jgi:PAS domain-containing protein
MASHAEQRPIELILARNFLSSLTTPAMLVNRPGDIVFFNEAAGGLLGQRFEEVGTMSAKDWTQRFGPIDDEGNPIPVEAQPLTASLRQNRPGHADHRIRSVDGACHDIEVSGLPIMGAGGFQGAMIIFWRVREAVS